MTLLSFERVFGSGDYIMPTLVAILAGGGVAAGAGRLGLRALYCFSLSVTGLVWYLTAVFTPAHGFLGLPTPAALDALGRLLDNARALARIEVAPVPLRPGYVIAAAAALWLAAAIAQIATFAWKRPLLATAPAIALFSFALVVGSGAGTGLAVGAFLSALFAFWGLEASHRMRSSDDRAGARPRRPRPPSTAIALRMTAAAVAAALAAPLFLPGPGEALLSWRMGLSGTQPGTPGGGRLDPLVSLAPRLITQSNEELFRVEASSPSYWRLLSLSEFDGETWRPERETRRVPVAGAGGSAIATPDDPGLSLLPGGAPTAPLDQRFTLTGLQGELLPAATQVVQVDLYSPGRTGASDAVVMGSDGSVSLDGDVDDARYLVRSHVVAASYERLNEAGVPSGAGRYTRLPAGLSERIPALARRWTAGRRTPLQRLVAIQQRLRQFTYSLDVENDASGDHLTRFLLETKSGYCQQFAAAFAVLARTLGYPARVSVGFLTGERAAGDPNRFVVRGRHAHAWPEVYFDGHGWIPFEPTPRSIAAPPAHTIAAGGAGSRGGPLDATLGPARAGPATTLPRSGDRGPEGSDGGREPPEAPGLGTARWQDAFQRLAFGAIVLGTTVLVAVPLLKWQRMARRYRRARLPHALASAAFSSFEDEAAELVRPRNVSETARGYAGRIAGTGRVPEEVALRLAELYDAGQYGRDGISAQDAAEALRLARRLSSGLWSSASWPERARRLFSPRRLLAANSGA